MDEKDKINEELKELKEKFNLTDEEVEGYYEFFYIFKPNELKVANTKILN